MQAHLLTIEALLRALVEREESIILPLLEAQTRYP